MDFYGCHFEYAGELSRKYGLVIANVNTDRNILLSGSVQSVSAFNKRNNTKYDLGNVYSEAPLVFEMEVIAEHPIESDWRRKIQKWLFNQCGFKKLYIDRADGVLGEAFELNNGSICRTYLNCKFINPEKIEGNGGIMGYKFVVECDSHLAWQDPIRIRHVFPGGSNVSNTIYVMTDTDSDCYIYPRISINTGSIGGDISFTNLSDIEDRLTTFSGLPENSEVVINGSYNYVSGNHYERFVNRNFPRLIDGKNEILLSGDIVSIEIEWQNMRYL